MKRFLVAAAAGLLFVTASSPAGRQGTNEASDSYLSWTASDVKRIGESTYVKGRVHGGETRWLKTERAFNYKLRATWLTPEVIRASARLNQLRDGLSDEQTRNLVAQAEAVGDTVIMVELDPDEGSGVIPLTWRALLHPRGVRPGSRDSVTGVDRPDLHKVPALTGVRRRNYDYDQFWVVFPLRTEEGNPLFPPGSTEAELVVRVYDQEGRVHWRIPNSIREQVKKLMSPAQ